MPNAELYAGYTGSSFLWSTGATTQSIVVNASNNVWVKVTDQNNCIGYDTIMATVVNSVLPNIGSDLLKCDSDTTILNSGQQGLTYLWSTGSTNDTININQTGSYWVELTDLNNCVSFDTVEVEYNPRPVLDLGIDMNYCDSANFDIAQNNATYLWDNGSTMANRTILSSGQYWAVINDTITTCSSNDTVNIAMSATPIVNLGNDDILCNGEYSILDAGYPQYSFLWNLGDTTQTIVASATGIYSVDVTTPQGCVGNDSILITISNPLDPNLGNDFVLCRNSVAQISSPINNASYTWILNDTVLSDTTQTIIVSQTGELISFVTTDIGCTATDTIELLNTSSEVNAVFLAATNGSYTGDTIQFINISHPNPYTSHWDFGDGSYSIQESPTHVYLLEGTYNALLTVDNGICTDTMNKKIVVLLSSKKRIDDKTAKNKILNSNLYPNPNDGQFTLSIELLEKAEVEIECFDLYGRLVMAKSIHSKEITVKYNMSELKTGLYVIRIRIDEDIEYIKFIKH